MPTNLTKKFMWTWKAANGPNLIPELKFHPLRKWRFDFARMDAGVAIELEGGVWTGGRHTSPSGFLKDIEKYNEAAFLGWTVFRLSRDNINLPTIQRLAGFIEKRISDNAN